MTEYPFVSVIIPIRNESAYIECSMLNVLTQDYTGKMEILIVDGMSTDDTRAFLRKMLPQYSSVMLLNNPARIVSAAMNIALKHASGDIIARIDGHCEIRADYIARCVALLSGKDVQGVGGPIETIGQGFIAETIALGMSSPFGVGGSSFRINQDKEMYVDTIPFPAYKREVINQVGLYDEELVRNQDDEYNYRVRKAGGRLLLSPDLKTRYYSRSTLPSLFKQYFQYGYWKVRVLQKHPRQMQWRQFVPVAFVTAVLGTAALFAYAVSWPFIFVASAYLCANIAASVIVAARRGIRYLPLLPVVFATLHISYGAGFLVGLFRFIHRWGDRKGKVPEWDGSVGRSVGGSE